MTARRLASIVLLTLPFGACSDRLVESDSGSFTPPGLASVVGDLAEFKPDQAIVFDGSTATDVTYGIAFKDDVGFLLDLGDVGFTCPETAHRSPGGLVLVFHDRGVFQPTISSAGPVAVPVVPAELPPELQGLETDCDLLEVLDALESYLDDVTAAADQVVAQVEDCLDTARDLYCHAVTAVEAAEVIPPTGEELFHSNDDDDGTVFNGTDLPSQAPCTAVLELLHQIPAFRDALESRRLDCLQTHTTLLAIEQEADQRVFENGGLTADEKEALLAAADDALAAAEQNLESALLERAALDDLIAAITPEAIAESCEDCTPDSPGFAGLVGSGAVLVSFGHQPLGRYVGSFRSAADEAAETDPELAAQLDDLARRLAGMDGDRVMQVIYPSASAVGQEHLAVARPEAPDDGVSPRVVVLTALEEKTLPQPNAADLQLLFDAFRQFRATLRRVGEDPPPAR